MAYSADASSRVLLGSSLVKKLVLKDTYVCSIRGGRVPLAIHLLKTRTDVQNAVLAAEKMVLLFGGNDVSRHSSLNVLKSDYSKLIAEIRLINPNLGHNELVVSEILPRGNFSPAQEEARVGFNRDLRRRTLALWGVSKIEMDASFTYLDGNKKKCQKQDLFNKDLTHPNMQGEELMQDKIRTKLCTAKSDNIKQNIVMHWRDLNNQPEGCSCSDCR